MRVVLSRRAGGPERSSTSRNDAGETDGTNTDRRHHLRQAPSQKCQHREAGKGQIGMSHKRSSMSAFHFGSIGVEGFELLMELQCQGQADRHLRRRHGENENKHDLAIRLDPARAGDDKGQASGI